MTGRHKLGLAVAVLAALAIGAYLLLQAGAEKERVEQQEARIKEALDLWGEGFELGIEIQWLCSRLHKVKFQDEDAAERIHSQAEFKTPEALTPKPLMSAEDRHTCRAVLFEALDICMPALERLSKAVHSAAGPTTDDMTAARQDIESARGLAGKAAELLGDLFQDEAKNPMSGGCILLTEAKHEEAPVEPAGPVTWIRPEDLDTARPEWLHVSAEQIAAAKQHGVPVAFENDVGMRFVLIPAGTFTMGSPEDEPGRTADEEPHEVTITAPLYVQVTEVDEAALRRFLIGRTFPPLGFPGSRISWEEAQRFAAWLTARDGSRTYRLPTEAEWEYACRAGTTTRYSFGDRREDLVRYGNFSAWGLDGRARNLPGLDDGHKQLAPSAVFEPNPWGLFDIHGNLWEWCQDWYAWDYPAASARDPTGPGTGIHRVMRGGSWWVHPESLRSAARACCLPTGRPTDGGFRLVSPLPGKEEKR